LVYEQDGQLVQQAWRGDQAVESALPITRGTSPRWDRDGRRIVMERELQGAIGSGGYEVAVRDLRGGDIVFPALAGETIRSPVWSPDETHVGWFSRTGGETAPWEIRLASLAEPDRPRTIARDVVVNRDFKTEGPSWEPSGRRVWFFSHGHRHQAYYPILAAGITTNEMILVNYPQRCTTPNDLAVNPVTGIPEIAFVAHSGTSQDLYIVFLNHF
jgi:Tol biopolymer transport system component